MAVAKAVHADSADDVEKGIAVDIGYSAARRMVDHHARHQREALQAGGDVLIFLRAQCLAFGARDRGLEGRFLIRGRGNLFSHFSFLLT